MAEVVVGLVVRGDSVLMLKRSKSEGLLQWNFPGGKIEAGESIEDALKREIREETGLSCSVQELLGSRVHPNTGATIHYAVCSIEGGEAINLEPAKAEAIAWVKNYEVESLVTSDLFPAVKNFLNS